MLPMLFLLALWIRNCACNKVKPHTGCPGLGQYSAFETVSFTCGTEEICTTILSMDQDLIESYLVQCAIPALVASTLERRTRISAFNDSYYSPMVRVFGSRSSSPDGAIIGAVVAALVMLVLLAAGGHSTSSFSEGGIVRSASSASSSVTDVEVQQATAVHYYQTSPREIEMSQLRASGGGIVPRAEP
ncbi:hypothetical protein M406DRAFT_326178 [Cryphonectria parasitica EP155]|uniref:Uncharacterized protein n=1 Tax=Cryphonectria parasitica (strain ATCC 38755 / EP155) TaxID=660469 RepID=A0A9P4YCX9_CRYP1|nr:uncharacterized protein M406DRAFT_326178 [Cryphonectria parasitica EP155]KAF3770755.1 hypothetical protein M406DRAFT_326178 [Cryphonectria parasitica EP155]